MQRKIAQSGKSSKYFSQTDRSHSVSVRSL